MAPVLGYWAIRGIGQPARLMLKYAGVEFEDKRYPYTGYPTFDPKKHENWFDVKFTLGLDFPNLPYYMDGEVKLTQSSAILRYIARKYNLYGSNDKENAVLDMLYDELTDVRSKVYDVIYFTKTKEEVEEKKKNNKEFVTKKLEQIEKFLGDKKWLIGDKLTYVDFYWYDMLDHYIYANQNGLKNFPKLQAYHDRFEQLPAIKAYMALDEYVKAPRGPLGHYPG